MLILVAVAPFEAGADGSAGLGGKGDDDLEVGFDTTPEAAGGPVEMLPAAG